MEFRLEKSPTEKADNSLATGDAFLINWKNEYFAYLNSCPHTLVNLNWSPNQFLEPELRYIQCSMHGALFEPSSGLCIRGPCLGRSLLQLTVSIYEGVVFVGSD